LSPQAQDSTASPARQLIPAWLWLSVLTVLLWGGWGIQSRIAVDRLSVWMNQFLFPLGFLPAVIWLMFSKRVRAGKAGGKGAFYAFITGVLGGTGNIALYLAMSRGGKASVVVPMVGMAPLVTVLMAWRILHEHPTRAQIAGIVLAVVAGCLLSL
jgi:transporter family protein